MNITACTERSNASPHIFLKFRIKTAIYALSVATLAFFANPVNAQTSSDSDDEEEESAIEELVVTGSSIRREDLEGSLPVQIITSDDIERSGVTSAGDLIARLPAMQGFLTEGDSVGGGGGGTQTASIHNLGGDYTLTLLNGRRIAPVDSGSLVDLGNIPIHLIERVEILTDGASALYGSDAIGGVLNIILKQSIDRISVGARFDSPSRAGGGGSSSISITGGAGSYEADGYSAIFSFSQHSRDSLKAVDRDFAKTGIFGISDSASQYPLRFFAGSVNAIPGNALASWWTNTDLPYHDEALGGPTDKDGNPVLDADDQPVANTRDVFVKGELMFPGVGKEGDAGYLVANYNNAFFNPYYENNRECAPNTARVGTVCQFDYTSTLEIHPDTVRDTLYGQFNFKISDDLHGFASALISSHTLTSRIAPYPTGGVPLPHESDLVATYILPHLADGNITADQLECVLETEEYTKEDGSTDARVAFDSNGMAKCATNKDGSIKEAGTAGTWRALPAGNRTTEYEISANNFIFGLEGSANSINYKAGVTVATTETDQRYPDGWLYLAGFGGLVTSGELNIFEPLSELPANTATLLAPTVYHGDWDNTKIDILVLDGTLNMPIFTMEGGEAQVAAGFDHRTTSYLRTIAPANANEELLFLSKDTPYDFERSQLGLFGEILLPIQDNLEIDASLRFDDISGISGIAGSESISSVAFDNLTYKASVRWDIRDNLAFRASTGTGFRAPTMRQIGEPRSDFGVTSGSFNCPFTPANDPEGKRNWCVAEKGFQAAVYRQGTRDLEAETSNQLSFGIVYNINDFNVTVDYWSVDQNDIVARIAESSIFENPEQYYDLFTYRLNQSTGKRELAIIQQSDNIASSNHAGIDFRVEKSFDFSGVQLILSTQGTHLLETRGGDFGGEVGRFNPDDEVAFRNIIVYSAELQHSNDFTHTLQFNYRSGYKDQVQELPEILPDGSLGDDVEVNRKVDEYQTMDYQLRYIPSALPDLSILVGVNNLLDEDPPLSIRSSGAGHQLGYDPRYTDVIGQTIYVGVDYSF